MKFRTGVIGRILGVYAVIEPPEPMMRLSLYGTKMNVQGTFSDNLGGQVKVVWDKVEYRPRATMTFPAEHGIDICGHTKTMLRYCKHMEECLGGDREPSPSVVDGAMTVSAGDAAWTSIREGRIVKVFNDF